MTAGKRIAAALVILAIGIAAAMPFYRREAARPESPPAKPDKSRTESTNVALQIPADGTKRETAQAAPKIDPANVSAEKPTVAPTFRGAPVPGAGAVPATPPIVSRDFPESQEKLPPVTTARRPVERSSAARGGADRSREASGDGPKVHRVRDGDSLRELAQRYLGDSQRWREIYDANREALRDAELLPIGLEIRIPPAGRSPAPPDAPTSNPPVTPVTKLVPIE